jgi:hypothetical protein
MGELAEAVSVHSSISHIVARLEAGGFVRRSRAAGDARNVIVSLTATGRKTASHLSPKFVQLDHALVSGLSEAERKTLEKLLDRMYANVLAMAGYRASSKFSRARVASSEVIPYNAVPSNHARDIERSEKNTSRVSSISAAVMNCGLPLRPIAVCTRALAHR